MRQSNGRNADVIKSYRRALNSGVVRIQEAATKEADARGCDLDVVESMMQKRDNSMCELLQEANRTLQDLAEEARTSWEEWAAFYAARITILAGEVSEALDERRWFRRDCLEYQDELDWEMRAYCRVSSELKPSEMSLRMRRAALQ
jgi:chemotaxis regulatin CheY-phosphate phosphatase CheZ